MMLMVMKANGCDLSTTQTLCTTNATFGVWSSISFEKISFPFQVSNRSHLLTVWGVGPLHLYVGCVSVVQEDSERISLVVL